MNRLSIACGRQLPLTLEPQRFNATEGSRRKSRGQAKALSTAGEWTNQALEVVKQVAMTNETFTSDLVRSEAQRTGLAEAPGRGSWGAVMTLAAQANYCRRTDRVRPCERVAARHRLTVVWVSLIWRAI